MLSIPRQRVTRRRKKLSKRAINALAKSRVASVRMRLARSPICPRHLLIYLSRDENELVRAAVARNPKSPPGLLHGLASDVEVSVRLAVATNRATAASSLAILENDADKQVKYVARRIIEVRKTQAGAPGTRCTGSTSKRLESIASVR